jgi:hypothetical protein
MRRIRSDDLAWTEPVNGVRWKTAVRSGRQVRLVEFAAGFCEADWCCKGHTGYVLAGRLEVVFADCAEVFSPGDILMISAGDGDKHRARVVEGPVRLFLVEQA